MHFKGFELSRQVAAVSHWQPETRNLKLETCNPKLHTLSSRAARSDLPPDLP